MNPEPNWIRTFHPLFRLCLIGFLASTISVASPANLMWTTTNGSITDGGGTWNQGVASLPSGAPWYNGTSYGVTFNSGDDVTFGGGASGAGGTITNAAVSPGNITFVTNANPATVYTIGVANTANAITMSGGNITNNAPGNTTFNAPLNGSFAYFSPAAHQLQLLADGNQTPADTVTVSSGFIQLGANSGHGSWGSATLINNNSISWRRFGNFTNSNAMSGSGRMQYQLNSSVCTLTAPQTHTGYTMLTPTSGTAGNSTLLMGGNNLLSPNSDFIIQQNASPANSMVLDFNGFNQTMASISDVNGTLTGSVITNSSATFSTLTLRGNNLTKSFNGLIAGKLGLTLNGTNSTLTLSNANTYTGSTTINAGTLALGGNGSIAGTPLINVTGPGALVVNNVLSLTGTLNINGGTVQANAISAGGGSMINLNAGTLILTNTAGTPAAPLTALNLINGTVHMNVNGSSIVTNIVATTVTSSGTTTIVIDSLANVTTNVTFPLVSYTGTDPYWNLSLALPVDVPAGFSGRLVDDTTNHAIDLTISSGPINLAVGWTNYTGQSVGSNSFGINCFGAYNYYFSSTSAYVPAYSNAVHYMKPGFIRVWAGYSMITNDTQASYAWDFGKIDRLYSLAATLSDNLMINTMPWPPYLENTNIHQLWPTNYGTYAAFVGQLINHLKTQPYYGKIKYFEILNEADLYYMGSSSDMAELGKIYSQVAGTIRTNVASTIKIGGPAFDHVLWGNAPSFLQQAQNQLDFVSYHWYQYGDTSYKTNTADNGASNAWSAAQSVGSVTAQVKGMVAANFTNTVMAANLEYFLDEYNISGVWQPTTDPNMTNHVGMIYDALTMIASVQAGVSGSAPWNDVNDGFGKFANFTSPTDWPIRPSAYVQRFFNESLQGSVVQATSGNPKAVDICAVANQNSGSIALVNRSETNQNIQLTFRGWSGNPAPGATVSAKSVTAYLATWSTNYTTVYLTNLASGYLLPSNSVTVLTFQLGFPPFISQSPSDQTVISGGNATFGVTATGTPPLSYQWRAGTNGNYVNLNNGGGISGSATVALTNRTVSTATATNYVVVITNLYGSVTSSVATLTVLLPSPPKLAVPALSGTSFIIAGTNGTANATYYLLASTNVALPLTNWTRLETNIMDAQGEFAITNGVDYHQPQLFYRLELP